MCGESSKKQHDKFNKSIGFISGRLKKYNIPLRSISEGVRRLDPQVIIESYKKLFNKDTEKQILIKWQQEGKSVDSILSSPDHLKQFTKKTIKTKKVIKLIKRILIRFIRF